MKTLATQNERPHHEGVFLNLTSIRVGPTIKLTTLFIISKGPTLITIEFGEIPYIDGVHFEKLWFSIDGTKRVPWSPHKFLPKTPYIMGKSIIFYIYAPPEGFIFVFKIERPAP